MGDRWLWTESRESISSNSLLVPTVLGGFHPNKLMHEAISSPAREIHCPIDTTMSYELFEHVVLARGLLIVQPNLETFEIKDLLTELKCDYG